MLAEHQQPDTNVTSEDVINIGSVFGFVDELGNFDTAVARARNLENIADANLVRYQQPFNLASMFSLFGKAEGNVIKVDLGIDFPKLQTGRPYFLSPMVVH